MEETLRICFHLSVYDISVSSFSDKFRHLFLSNFILHKVVYVSVAYTALFIHQVESFPP